MEPISDKEQKCALHATVHLRTRLEPGATVPIGWVAVGDPASILPPDQARPNLGPFRSR